MTCSFVRLINAGQVITDRGKLGQIKRFLCEKFSEGVVDTCLVNHYFVVSEIDHLFVGVVAEANDSFQTFRFQLFRVDRRKHFLKTATDHLDLGIFAKVIEDDKWILKSEAERLATVVENVFHSAVIHDSECHLSATNLDYSYVIS